ncbi:MAG: CPBP family intramembrane metalloprotease [Symploca sp. SIO2C1]|nr:CPBP family intramembrane metalloprotease [Symploca sp. SIO2C1]
MNTDSSKNSENPFINFKARSLIIWALLISLALGFVLGIVSQFSSLDPNEPIYSLIIYNLIFILLCFWAIERLNRLGIKVNYLFGHLPSNYGWLPTLGIVITILLFSLGSGQLLFYILSFVAPEWVESVLSDKNFLSTSENIDTILNNILTVITVVVVARVTEELLFRGILLHRWTAKWGIIPALLLSSLLFGILHVNIIGLFVFGLMMALLYLKTRTLIVPIVCHSLNNLAAVGIGLLSDDTGITGSADILEQLHSYWWVGIIYIALSAPWLIYFIYQNWPNSSFPLPYSSNAEQ